MSDEQKVEVVDTPQKKSLFNNKNKSKARKIVEWVLFGLFGAMFAFVMAANIDGIVHRKENYGQTIRFGTGSFIILTNSMEPEIKKDDAIITYKEDIKTFKSRLEKGEKIDITFMNEDPGIYVNPDTPKYHGINPIPATNKIMTHRLVEIHVDESIPYGKGRYAMIVAGINSQGQYSKETQYQLLTERQYLGVVKISNTALGKMFSFMTSAWGLIILLLLPAIYLLVSSTIDIFKTLKESEEKQEQAKNEPQPERLSGLSDEEKAKLKKQLLEEMIKEKRAAKEKGNDGQK